ncbi:MAG: hypothetical protein EBR30_29970 [Cytophagia bacterium]|nr:hypothetical protein [Cytophagia bacterium]
MVDVFQLTQGSGPSDNDKLVEFANFYFDKEIGSVDKNKLNWIVDYKNLKTNSTGKFGKTVADRENHVINIYINPAALNLAKALYITVGHELVHANDINNGNELRWYQQYPKSLQVIMEWHAYRWSADAEIGFGVNYGQVQALNQLKTMLPPGFYGR